jgi:hypothetical protein
MPQPASRKSASSQPSKQPKTIDPDFKNAESLTTTQPKRRRASLQCPKYATRLRVRRFQGVAIDICPDCAGMWFDRGEFDIATRDKGEQWTARFLKNLTNLITNPTPVRPK